MFYHHRAQSTRKRESEEKKESKSEAASVLNFEEQNHKIDKELILPIEKRWKFLKRV